MRKTAGRILPLIAAIFALLYLPASAGETVIKIGVYTRGNFQRAIKEWTPTAEYLGKKLPGYRFKIVPLTFTGVDDAVGRREVGFIIVNPELYVEMEMAHGANRLVTMKRKVEEHTLTVFGGVIFCRADRPDIVSFDGLVAKRFAAVDRNSFGGWIAALYELRKVGVNIPGFFRDISFKGSGEAVVQAVLSGAADAGTVRTGTLERMAAAGELDIADLRILRPLEDRGGFPLLRSTPLYPEWVMARASHIPFELAENVAVALMTMPHDGEAARASGTAGWTIPDNYHRIVDVLTELKIGPFADAGKITFADVLKTYWKQAFLLSWLIGTLIGVAGYIVTLNRRLGKSQKELTAELAERRLAEEKLRNITEMLGEGVYVLDENGAVIFMNPVAEKLLGWKEEELMGKNLHDAVHHTRTDGSPFPRAQCPAARALLAGESYRAAEDHFFRKDGSMFPVAFVSTPLRRNGTVAGAVSIFRDITEEKRANAELITSKNAALEATKLKDKFVSLVAHDLRSPFGTIIGYMKMLHKDVGQRLEPRQREMLEKSLASAESLVYMIEELLDISRLQTGTLIVTKTPVDARTMAGAALDRFSPLAEEKGITLTNDIPRGAILHADFQLYPRVLQNLVSNAVKFCRRGDTIRAFVYDKLPNTIAIADTGVGVPPDILPDIFKHEEKTTTPGTAGEAGTGLGLPFSHDIMKAHGGSLWVESESGKGSTFYLTLPPTP